MLLHSVPSQLPCRFSCLCFFVYSKQVFSAAKTVLQSWTTARELFWLPVLIVAHWNAFLANSALVVVNTVNTETRERPQEARLSQRDRATRCHCLSADNAARMSNQSHYKACSLGEILYRDSRSSKVALFDRPIKTFLHSIAAAA